MKKGFKVSAVYKTKNQCIDHKVLDKKGCLKGKKMDDFVTLRDIMNDNTFTPLERVFWLMEHSLTILEKEQLLEYFKQRWLRINGKHVNVHLAKYEFLKEKTSPLNKKGEFNSLLEYLNLL